MILNKTDAHLRMLAVQYPISIDHCPSEALCACQLLLQHLLFLSKSVRLLLHIC